MESSDSEEEINIKYIARQHQIPRDSDLRKDPSPNRRRCGTPGCTKKDYHSGPCMSHEPLGCKRARLQSPTTGYAQKSKKGSAELIRQSQAGGSALEHSQGHSPSAYLLHMRAAIQKHKAAPHALDHKAAFVRAAREWSMTKSLAARASSSPSVHEASLSPAPTPAASSTAANQDPHSRVPIKMLNRLPRGPWVPFPDEERYEARGTEARGSSKSTQASGSHVASCRQPEQVSHGEATAAVRAATVYRGECTLEGEESEEECEAEEEAEEEEEEEEEKEEGEEEEEELLPVEQDEEQPASASDIDVVPVVRRAKGYDLHLSSTSSSGYKCVVQSKLAGGRVGYRVSLRGRHIGWFETAVEAAVSYAREAGVWEEEQRERCRAAAAKASDAAALGRRKGSHVKAEARMQPSEPNEAAEAAGAAGTDEGADEGADAAAAAKEAEEVALTELVKAARAKLAAARAAVRASEKRVVHKGAAATAAVAPVAAAETPAPAPVPMAVHPRRCSGAPARPGKPLTYMVRYVGGRQRQLSRSSLLASPQLQRMLIDHYEARASWVMQGDAHMLPAFPFGGHLAE